jgi:hypothetical protein
MFFYFFKVDLELGMKQMLCGVDHCVIARFYVGMEL